MKCRPRVLCDDGDAVRDLNDTGDADDGQPVAGFEVRPLDARERGQAGRRQARRVGITHAVGDMRHRLSPAVFGDQRVLGVRAVFARDAEHPVVLRIALDTRPGADDDARKILTEHEGQRVSVLVPHLPVHRIDARDRDSDENVIRTRFGNGHVPQRSRFVKMFDNDSTHAEVLPKKGLYAVSASPAAAKRASKKLLASPSR